MDACVTSQFEQQARAICGQPLGPVTLSSPVVMANLLGDLWFAGGKQHGTGSKEYAFREPNWATLQAQPGTHLHLYGKAEARPGRKMGHFNVMATDVETALQRARETKKRTAP
jgi:5-(carboxyamino)imidazole ribonucleotide synthase